MGTSVETVKKWLSRFGELRRQSEEGTDGDDGLYMPAERRYCFASFDNIASAQAVYDYLNTNPDLSELGVSRVVCRYAQIATVKEKDSGIDCTSSTDDIVVPGLVVLPEFITEEDEQQLLHAICSDDAPWKLSLNRRVQHYGFPFNYRTLMVDYNKPTPPLPSICKLLADKILLAYTDCIETRRLEESPETVKPINQLTINEYQPGQGIHSHTDTTACFGPVLFILNIGSGIVMNLTKNSDRSTSPCEDEKKIDETAENSKIRKYVYLPPRSLLILSGDSRYCWSHGINPRKVDKVNGDLVSRGRRISFTFRHVMRPGPIPAAHLTSGSIEQEHVVKVYDAIALHWNHTRGKRKVHWHRVKDFIEGLPKGALVADIGSGDGKYFGLNPHVTTIGCDRSLKLLEVSKLPGHEVFACDAVKLPFMTESFDAVLCIAVLHHLATIDRRFAVISELMRIARDDGDIFIQAWALEQDEHSKHVFETQDTMVPWKLNKRFLHENHSSPDVPLPADQDDIIVYERYCHVYKEGELEEICSQIPGCEIVESGWDRGNWFVRLKKVQDLRLSSDYTGPEAKLPFRPSHSLAK